MHFGTLVLPKIQHSHSCVPGASRKQCQTKVSCVHQYHLFFLRSHHSLNSPFAYSCNREGGNRTACAGGGWSSTTVFTGCAIVLAAICIASLEACMISLESITTEASLSSCSKATLHFIDCYLIVSTAYVTKSQLGSLDSPSCLHARASAFTCSKVKQS